MTPEGIDTQNVDALLLSIVNSAAVVHLLMLSGKLAISGPVKMKDQYLEMDISSIPTHFFEPLGLQDTTAIVFLNGAKLSWQVSIAHLTKSRHLDDNVEPCLLLEKPKNITFECGRKAPREMMAARDIKIKISGNEETFSLVDLSPGGCAFSAPSLSVTRWVTGEPLDFEAISGQTRFHDKLRIVRVSYNMQGDVEHESIVSCKFENENFGSILLLAKPHRALGS